MELKDEQKINASREKVYAALNDPEILQQCIPGCEALEKISDTEMVASITLKVGPVKVKMKGAVELTNLNPPISYTITGEGKGGPAGFAKGGADITLIEEADGTLLQYSVKVDIGGKIAQLGTRLMDSTARKLSAQFFEKFSELVGTELNQELPPQMISEETVIDVSSKSGDKKSMVSNILIYVSAVLAIAAGYALYAR